MKPSELIKFERPLRAHQCEALDRFAFENEAALFWEMGTGKSTAAIALLRAKYNQAKMIRPTLIVSPVATLENWLNEFRINAPVKVQQACQIVHGAGPKRIKQLSDTTKSIFITNPETFTMPTVVKRMQAIGIECVIVDEADGFKNPKSKRLKSLLTITDKAQSRVILTGTPILNNYLDLWAQYRILDCGRTFSTNFYLFRERYFFDKNVKWRAEQHYFPDWQPKPHIDSHLSEIMARKASRLKKTDCLQLPPLVMMTEHVPMSDAQKKAYDEMEDELITQVTEGTCVASNALTRVLRMLQILSGYIQVESLSQEKFAVTLKQTPRLQRLKELLLELTPQNKVVVWCVFRENYFAIRALCESLNIQFAELTGDTKDRQAQIDLFNKNPACRVMISNPSAGGVGVNMTADDSLASYVIYYSRGYSLRHRLQSLARTHRGGAEKYTHVTAIDLVAPGTIEVDVLNSLERKENFAELVLEKIRLRKDSVQAN